MYLANWRDPQLQVSENEEEKEEKTCLFHK